MKLCKKVKSLIKHVSGYLFLLAGMLAAFSSCRYPVPDMTDWDIPTRTKDSLSYLATYHYTFDANFIVSSDSLLLEQLPVKEEYLPVYRDDRLVVAEFMVQPADSADSVWVKVARDQVTQGWIRQKDLLRNIVPSDSVSQFIHLFSNVHSVYFLLIFILFVCLFLVRAVYKKRVLLVYFNDIDSIFPILLCLLTALAATLYGTLQTFYPDTWEHFYFNPGLNPFKLPFILGLFMAVLWISIVVFLAVLDDLFHQASFSTACFYLLGLLSVCIFCYLFFTFTTSFYIGYVGLGYLFYVSIRRIRKGTSYRYRCGQCGTKIREKGECPRCGAINQ